MRYDADLGAIAGVLLVGLVFVIAAKTFGMLP